MLELQMGSQNEVSFCLHLEYAAVFVRTCKSPSGTVNRMQYTT